MRPIVRCWLVAVVALLAAIPSVSGAEDERRKEPGRSRTMIVLRISEVLGLDEKQTYALAADYRRFDERRHALLGERQIAEAELEAALERSSQDEDEIRQRTDRLLAIDKELVLMPDALFESLEDELTIAQRGRLALLKVRLQRKIANERSRRQGQPGKKGPPAP